MLLRGFIGSVLVLLGGLVVAVLPPSAPILESELLGALRGGTLGRMTGLTLVLVGLGLLAHAWLGLCRQVAHADDDEEPGEAIDLVRFATVVWSLPLLIAPPLFSRDGWSYAAQGMMAKVGISPYDFGPEGLLPGGRYPVFIGHTEPIVQAVDPMWMSTATSYGPVPLWFGSSVADVTGNPWMLAIAHRGLALVGLVLLAWAVPRLASWSGTNPALASAIVLASPLMLANGVAGLHNDLLMVGLMAAALVVAVERGWIWGAALGGVAAAVKVPGGLVCIAIVLVSLPVAATLKERLRRFAQVGGVSLGTLFGLGVVSGLGQGWIAALTVPGSISTPLSITSMTGNLLDTIGRMLGLGLPDGFFRAVVRGLGLLVVLGVIAWVSLRWQTGDRSRAIAATAVVAGAFVVLCPAVHLWYLLVLPPFLATIELPRLGRIALLAGSVVFGLVAPLDSSLHGAYLAIIHGSMLVAVLVPMLLLTRPARERIDRIVVAVPTLVSD